VVPFSPERLPAGWHVPHSEGATLAYDLTDEPGGHRFGAVASPLRLDPAELEEALRRDAALPAGATLVEQPVEAR